MKESRSLNVFIGIMVFILLWLFVSGILEMRLLGSIMDKLVSVGALTLIILFQDEIRKFLYNLGAHQRIKSLTRLFRSGSKKEAEADKATIMPIVMACMNMARKKVGALIVLERDSPLDDIIQTGDVIDANINQRLIENIFFKNSPLTAPPWASRRRAMPLPSSAQKRLGASAWPCAGSSNSDCRPSSSRACFQKKSCSDTVTVEKTE